jgi:hypothetical protein
MRVRNRLFKSVDELNESVRILKEADSHPDFENHRLACAYVMADIWEKLLGPIFREHPQLKPDEVKDVPF